MGAPLPTAFLAEIANTNIDGTGTIVTVFDAGQFGAEVDAINIKAAETTTAGMIRFYIGNGTRWGLLDEVAVTAITPSSSVKAFCYIWEPEIGPLRLARGLRLGVAPHNAESFLIHPQGRFLP